MTFELDLEINSVGDAIDMAVAGMSTMCFSVIFMGGFLGVLQNAFFEAVYLLSVLAVVLVGYYLFLAWNAHKEYSSGRL